MPWTPQGPYTTSGPFTAGNANNIETQYNEAMSSLHGNLLTAFVLTGLAATKDGTTASQLDVTAGTAYLTQADGTLRERAPTSSTQSCSGHPSTTLYLYLQPDGTWYWSTSNSPAANSLAVAQVTTDASANILTVTDERTTATSLLSAMIGALNLPSGAKAGGSKIWTQGNDGSGSGLDADTLDGHDSTYFAIGGTPTTQITDANAGSTSTPQVVTTAASGLSTQETTVGAIKHIALVPTEGDSAARGLSLGYVDAGGTYHEEIGIDSTAGLKFLPTGARYSPVSFFNGSGTGTFSHGLGATPSWVGITCNQSGSSMTVGVDSMGSTTCHVVTGGSLTWMGVAMN